MSTVLLLDVLVTSSQLAKQPGNIHSSHGFRFYSTRLAALHSKVSRRGSVKFKLSSTNARVPGEDMDVVGSITSAITYLVNAVPEAVPEVLVEYVIVIAVHAAYTTLRRFVRRGD